ncbi:MAG TPA: cobalamin biosynthesis protein [Polyangiales bacterium]|nr:cobalamin biosynthesis protein [Polyangiales bacterium]
MIAAGVGCTSGCAAGDIQRALVLSLSAAGRELGEVRALYAPDWKREHAGLREAAQLLGLPLCFVTRAGLEAEAPAAVSCSKHALDRAGVPSVAETAALAGARSGRLLGARTIFGGATCALASDEGEP